MKTEVIFRKEKSSGEIVAIFPYEISSKYFVTCFTQSESHSQCYYNWVLKETVPTKEYSNLFDVLTNGYGYDLKVIQKRKYSKYLNAYFSQYKK